MNQIKPRDRERIAARFWPKVNKTATCWLWTAAVFKGGEYGLFKLDGRCVKAHRIAYMLERGRIGRGLVLLHSCDNRRCVNPSHLTPDTHEANMLDMRAKGRSQSLDRHARARLSSSSAHEIRTAFMLGCGPSAIASTIGLPRQTVQDVIAGKTWVSRDWYRPNLHSS